MSVKFIPIKAHSYNHAANDKRKPTAYRVEVDGAVVGEVHSESNAVWRTNRSGTLRTTFRGYSRHWVAVLPCGMKDRLNYSRSAAAQRLIALAREGLET